MTDMRAEQPADDHSTALRFIEPALLVTVLTAATYFWGWNYIDAYFERLSIHHDSLDFPTTFYLREAFMPVMAAFVILAFSFIGARESKTSVVQALRGNIPGFAFAALALNHGIEEYPNWISYLLFANCVFVLIILVSMSLSKRSITELVIRQPRMYRSIGVIVVMMLVLLVSRYLGGLHARKTVDGSLHNVISIDINTKKTFPIDLSAKQLILILYRNGRFYVVEKEKEASEFPKVYLVPDSQVEYAVQQRIN